MVFFSLRPPGQRGDIDQLLWAGGQFWLMDAKHWRGAAGGVPLRYEVISREGDQLHFVRNGQPFKGGLVNTPKQLDLWRRYLSPHLVTSVIVLTNPEAEVAADASNRRTLVLTASGLQAWFDGFGVEGSALDQVWVEELARRAFEMPRPGPAAPAPTRSSPPSQRYPSQQSLQHPSIHSGIGASRPRPSSPSRTAGWMLLVAALLAWIAPAVGVVPALVATVGGLVVRKRLRAAGARSTLVALATGIGIGALIVNIAMLATAAYLVTTGVAPGIPS
ncbi:hypothetical protein [Agrococcus jenensis]|nr:hypothetical protein [Agrococcus jenensis]